MFQDGDLVIPICEGWSLRLERLSGEIALMHHDGAIWKHEWIPDDSKGDGPKIKEVRIRPYGRDSLGHQSYSLRIIVGQGNQFTGEEEWEVGGSIELGRVDTGWERYSYIHLVLKSREKEQWQIEAEWRREAEQDWRLVSLQEGKVEMRSN